MIRDWARRSLGAFLLYAGRSLADALGDLAFLLLPAQRRAVAHNLALVLDQPVDAPVVCSAARRAFRASARNFGALALLRFAGRRWAPRVSVEWAGASPETLEAPVIVVSAHLGPFDVVAATFARRGYRLVALAEPTGPGWFHHCVRWLRSQCGIRLVPPTPAGMLAAARAARSGIPVAFLVDRPHPGGRATRFFGVPVRLPEGAVRLARRLGCPIVPAFVYRTPDGYRLRFEAPISVEPGDDAMRHLAQVAERLEQAIRAAPDQWLVFRPVWDT
ncbi:MAG: lysophospholipid acyltransferase family protein [Thermomicrobium sp.]|nr:lysophospholipid acyltransferase family protein [Thermomicrobium sp.]